MALTFVASQFAWNSALPTGTALLQAEFLALYSIGFGNFTQVYLQSVKLRAVWLLSCLAAHLWHLEVLPVTCCLHC